MIVPIATDLLVAPGLAISQKSPRPTRPDAVAANATMICPFIDMYSSLEVLPM